MSTAAVVAFRETVLGHVSLVVVRAPSSELLCRHLRQRRFGLGQPERHLHGAVQRDSHR
jgi:hypothetical protein